MQFLIFSFQPLHIQLPKILIYEFMKISFSILFYAYYFI